MAEAEPSGHVGRPNQIDAQELVDCVHRRGPMRRRQRPPVRARTDRRPPPLLRARGVRRPTATRVPRSATPRPRLAPRGRSVRSRERRCVPPRGRATGRASLEVEGVATALLVEGGGAKGVDPVVEKLASLIRRERAELDPSQRRRTMRPLERRCKTLRRLARAERNGDEHCRPRRPGNRAPCSTEAASAQWEVVEHKHERLALRKLFEQRAHRSMAPIPLVLERHRATGCERRQRGQDVRELCLHVAVEGREQVGVEASTYSSNACTNTENGSARSSSDADPERTRCPRASARAASSERRRVLPIPGSPTSSRVHGGPRSSSRVPPSASSSWALSNERVLSARSSRCDPLRHQTSFGRYATSARSRRVRHQWKDGSAVSVFYGCRRLDSGGAPRAAKSGCRFRGSPDVGAAVSRQGRTMSRYLLQHRHELHECAVSFLPRSKDT